MAVVRDRQFSGMHSGGNARIPVAPGFQTPNATAIRSAVKIAVGAVEMITAPVQAEQIVALVVCFANNSPYPAGVRPQGASQKRPARVAALDKGMAIACALRLGRALLAGSVGAVIYEADH